MPDYEDCPDSGSLIYEKAQLAGLNGTIYHLSIVTGFNF